jgi:hypothetical protein
MFTKNRQALWKNRSSQAQIRHQNHEISHFAIATGGFGQSVIYGGSNAIIWDGHYANIEKHCIW